MSDLCGRRGGYTRWHPFDERYWGRVDRTPGCWNWSGSLDAKGYGAKVVWNGRPTRPHRIAYMLAHGEIPDGLVIDHLCRNRRCVNPEHLEPVTSAENTSRGTEARWSEDCPNGHPAERFRRALPSGKNVCVECRRISDRRRDERHKERRRAAARARYAGRKEAS